MKTAIVTDSNSGIFEKEAKKLGVYSLPMSFSVNGKWMYEGIDLTAEEFFKLQAEGAEITSSQPSPADVTDLWDRLLTAYDAVVYIPMTSGLSSSMATASMLAADYDGRVQVVDNKRISLTQRQSVLDAKVLADQGIPAVQIKNKLEEAAMNASIYLTVDNLKYLKKGGRVTPAAAAIGTVLNIKPVLQIQGGGIDAYAKVRGMHQAQEKMIDAMCKDLVERFGDLPMHLGIAYSGDPEEGEKWRKYVQTRFPKCKVQSAPLSLSVACHTGPGALGIGCYCYETEK